MIDIVKKVSMRQRILRAVTYLVIFFFTWTMGGMFNIAYAAYHEIQKPSSNKKQEQRPEEKFQKAIDDLRNIVSGKSSFETKRSKLREKRDAIESLDKEIKSQFADTENKLKKAGLPQAILQRHYNFVKNYEDNLKELRASLDAAENSKTDREFENKSKKIRQHLEKTSFKKKHTPLDPNKLPHRLSDIKRKEPRTKPAEFQKDIKQKAAISGQPSAFSVIPQPGRGIQPTTVIPVQTGIQSSSASMSLRGDSQEPWQSNNQPLLLASNGPLTGLVETLPKYEEPQNLPQPLFYPKGHTSKEGGNSESNFNSFNSPPLIKGDRGGFSTNNESPVMLALAHDAPTSADLSETIDVQLTPAIKAKAAELNYSPVKIYNWVRNNVEYVPTYGSIQGADMCLQTLQGNDFDIASLLIALLRASGIHARYVYGTIELPIDKVMNWVGGFTNANAALNFIASGGTPVEGLISGGKISAIRMEHVWVEAFVKFYPLRGAKHETGKGDSWIPLDACYKQYTYTQGIDINTAVSLDSEAILNHIQSTAIIDTVNFSITGADSQYIQQQLQDYQSSVKNYMSQNYPNATMNDFFRKKEIIKQNFSYLLGTLPYQKAIIGIKYSEIPYNLRHKITFKVTKDIYDTDMPINITKNLPEIAGKKITLSYSPATADDEAVINSYIPKPHADGTPIQPSELPTSLPAYLINLKPELRIDGVIVAAGTAVGMGYQETFNIVFVLPGPSGTTDIVSNQINAGAYYAVAFDTGKISQQQMLSIKAKLEDIKSKFDNNDFASFTKDDLIGEILYETALAYYFNLDAVNYLQSKNMGIAVNRAPSESIFSFELKVDNMFGVPRSVSAEGFIIDVDRNVNIVSDMSGDANKTIQFMEMSGMNSSALEHAVLEGMFSSQNNSIQAVSAVKALKIANDSSIPIFVINQSNINNILPQLQLDQNVIIDIQNAVNAGNVVTVSKTDITFNGWTGCGYIIIDPATGAGAYRISGGLNGAQNTNIGDFAKLLLATVGISLLVSALVVVIAYLIAAIIVAIILNPYLWIIICVAATTYCIMEVSPPSPPGWLNYICILLYLIQAGLFKFIV